MTTQREYHQFLDQLGALRQTLVDQLSSQLVENPQLADEITNQLDSLEQTAIEQAELAPQPSDQGLAQLVGLGPDAADLLADTHIPPAPDNYDENVTSERIIAVGDLYHTYQFEKIGVFRAVLKLQDMFKAGTVRLSSGQGAFKLYQYDRRDVLRHTIRDRMQAYRRVFGYTRTSPPPGAKPNRDFHNLYVNFANQVARFYRDKRISEVIRPQSDRHSFGSVAVVRRAGLDLRHNLKSASYGHINVLRVEMMQLLDEAFDILGSDDIRKLFGADSAWDVVEEVNRRYLGLSQINISQRSRMASAGRKVVRWLAQPHILNATRAEFEALLNDVADDAEEWLTSAEALGMTRRQPAPPSTRSRSARRPADVRELEWVVAE